MHINSTQIEFLNNLNLLISSFFSKKLMIGNVLMSYEYLLQY